MIEIIVDSSDSDQDNSPNAGINKNSQPGADKNMIPGLEPAGGCGTLKN